jgi:quinol monooxygenase YgiN
MSADTEPVTLIATFRAIEGQDSKVLSLIGEYGLAVRAEPGNIFFDIYTEHDDGHAFVIVERYSNQHAFDQHLAGDEGKVFNQQLAPMVEGEGSQLQFLRIAT